jgi:multidrug efflux pump subunit AcrA (membrane-fusion protein)
MVFSREIACVLARTLPGVIMSISAIIFSLLCAVTAQTSGSLPPSVTLNNCLVALDQEAYVPAQEAGVLKTLAVKEGQFVKEGELLAQIDDLLSQMECRVAANKFKAAEVEANNTINVEYADADAKVTEAVYQKNLEANRQVKGSVPSTELERFKLDWKRGLLSVTKANKDKEIAGYQALVSKAELDAAKEKIERRQIKSPLDGQVRKIDKRVGEWVLAGDTVLHVVRVNKLRIEGFLNISKFAPQEVINRPVMVKVVSARGRMDTFKGEIIFVDPMVQAGGEYLVRAKIDNREENGEWLLRAGMPAEMTILLK